MPILYGIIGGMFFGTLSAFLMALLATLPLMGWADNLVQPVFFLAGILSAAVFAWRSA